VTDPCIDWSTTETMIRKEADTLKAVLPQREAVTRFSLEK